jgi:hypothetical protein
VSFQWERLPKGGKIFYGKRRKTREKLENPYQLMAEWDILPQFSRTETGFSFAKAGVHWTASVHKCLKLNSLCYPMQEKYVPTFLPLFGKRSRVVLPLLNGRQVSHTKQYGKESPNWTIRHSILLRSSVREIPAAGEKMYNNESPFT